MYEWTVSVMMSHFRLFMCNFVSSAFIVSTIWLSADSTQKFSDLLLNHGGVDDAQMAIFTFSTLSASI